MTKILVKESIPADLDLGTVRPGTYELVHTTGRGEARNAQPEPAYLLDGLTVSKKQVESAIANNNAEYMQEDEMSNLPAVMGSEEVMSIERLKNHVVMVQNVMKDVMHQDEHFGIIPGCKKPSLWKPGAEKLSLTFRLAPYYDVNETDLSNGHKNFVIRCTLKHIGTGNVHGEGVGSCSTMETKYRFRDEERKCPKCGSEAIIRGKEEFGGGWLCFKKKKGCGSKFADGDQSIEGQKVGRVEYDNPADFYNTALKMAKKRAHIDATLTATAASDIFTQDIEDMVDNGAVEVKPAAQIKPPNPAKPPVKQPEPKPSVKPPSTVEDLPPHIDGSAPSPAGEQVIFIPEKVSKKSGMKNGKEWKRFGIYDGENWYNTFNSDFAQTAMDASDNGSRIKMIFKTGEFSRDAISVELHDRNPGQEG